MHAAIAATPIFFNIRVAPFRAAQAQRSTGRSDPPAATLICPRRELISHRNIAWPSASARRSLKRTIEPAASETQWSPFSQAGMCSHAVSAMTLARAIAAKSLILEEFRPPRWRYVDAASTLQK
jgi:hypothetical protein